MAYPASLAEAFWAHCVTSEDACWTWTGNRHSSGYGLAPRAHKDEIRNGGT